MPSWTDYPCAHCKRELPDTGNVMRRVPGRGGQLFPVHPACAEEIDRQAQLLPEPARRRVRARR